MISCNCQENAKKHGKDRNGNQRFRCTKCGRTFIEDRPRPLGDMRLDMGKAVGALKMLLEDMSIRAVERLTGIHRDTLCDLVVTVGQQCETFLRATNRDLKADDVECDEIWGFVGCKEKTRQLKGHGEDKGDAYCWVGIERNTKYVLTWLVGKRTSECCWEFADSLYHATHRERFQVNTDGYGAYQAAIPLIFQFGVDFAQIIKRFGGKSDTEADRRYSPANIVATKKTRGCGSPDLDSAGTSRIERWNLSVRMHVRRMTRLTNAHSKKWENHSAMLALYFAWYNYCRPHMTLGKGREKRTPAMAHGLTDHRWSIEELITAAAGEIPRIGTCRT